MGGVFLDLCQGRTSRTPAEAERLIQQHCANVRAMLHRRPGLGDLVAGVLHALGVDWLVARLLGHPCSACGQRQAALNRLGRWLVRLPGRVVAWARGRPRGCCEGFDVLEIQDPLGNVRARLSNRGELLYLRSEADRPHVADALKRFADRLER